MCKQLSKETSLNDEDRKLLSDFSQELLKVQETAGLASKVYALVDNASKTLSGAKRKTLKAAIDDFDKERNLPRLAE